MRDRALRVLLVEDEHLVAMLLGDMLSDLGHQVVGPLAQLAPALAAARCESVDLAILDINLKDGDSYPVAAALQDRGIPIIFSTGYDSAALAQRFPNAWTLQKPFQQDDLRKVIAAAR